jgi:gliding motility-associated-like protein
MKRIFTLFLLLPFLSYCQTALTGAQIEGAINEAVSKGRVVTASSGSVPESALSSLPVVFRTTIDDHKYDIVVTAMNFTATGSTLEVGARFVPNPEMPDQVLYFNSPAIGFSAKHGFKGEMALLPEILSSSKNNQLSPEAVSLLAGRNRFFEVIMQSSGNKMVLGLDENTRLSFNCGAFEKLTLSGYLKVFNSVNQEDIAGQNINSGLPLALVFPAQTVYDWNDIFLQATVANHFHSQKIKEFGFHFETPNSALIDFSIRQNPAGLPKCSAESGNYWKGVSLGSFNLRLPEIITRKDGVALSKVPSGGLFMDVNGGLIGQAGADKLIALEHGTTAGAQPLDASLEKAYVTFACNSKIDALLSGKIKVNGCDATARGLTSDYLFTFNESSGFSYKLNYKGGNSNMVTNEIKLESGSSLLVEVRDNGLFITQRANFTPSITTTAYNNSICRDHSTTLTIAGCPHAIEWSNGATTASITVNPTENTSYSARCYDPYCIEVITNTIDITVYESLETPVLASSRTVEPYCANIEAEISTSAFCPGIVQWSENGGAWTDGEATRKVHYPSISTPQTYTYKTQCKLNDCISEVSNEITLNILPKPSGPTLTKKPGGWTSCKETELHSTACDNGGILKWYRNDVYLGYMDGYRMRKETENGYYMYKVKCVTPNGCESDFSYENIHIDKCSCTPAPPEVSSPFHNKTAEYGTYIPLHGRSCPGTVVWYNSGDQMVGAGADFSHTEMGGPHYYKATCKDENGCESAFSGNIIINVEKCVNAPNPPDVFSKLVDTHIDQDVEYEEGTTVIIQASGCVGGTITWYNSGGGRIGTGENRNISDVGDHYFKATCTKGANNCESILSGWVRVRIGKCVNNISAPSVEVKGNSPFNTGSRVEIVATGCGNNTVEWYNSGHQVIGAGDSYYETLKGRHFHYAKCKAPNGCVSAGSAMTDFTIGDCVHTPGAPSISAASETVSGSQTTALTATGCTGTVKWSTGEVGNQINVGAGSYNARCEVNGCLSWNSNEVTVTGSDNPPACNFTFTVASDKQSVCGTDKATLTASGCSGGTVSWSTGPTETSIQVGSGTYTATCKKTGCGDKEASIAIICGEYDYVLYMGGSVSGYPAANDACSNHFSTRGYKKEYTRGGDPYIAVGDKFLDETSSGWIALRYVNSQNWVSVKINSSGIVEETQECIFCSDALIKSLQKNNCVAGTVGSFLSVTSTDCQFTTSIGISESNKQRDVWMQSHANQYGSCTSPPGITYYSEFKEASIQRNNCNVGETTYAIVISSGHGKFTSSVSVAEANNSRDEWMQEEANRLGICFPPTVDYMGASSIYSSSAEACNNRFSTRVYQKEMIRGGDPHIAIGDKFVDVTTSGWIALRHINSTNIWVSVKLNNGYVIETNRCVYCEDKPIGPTIIPSSFLVEKEENFSVSAVCPENTRIEWLAPSGFNGGSTSINIKTKFEAACRKDDICISNAESIEVDVCIEPIMPDGVSPNGDGYNDFLRLLRGGNCVKDFFIYISNRTGTIFFNSNDKNFIWDCKVDKKNIPEGTYYYNINADGKEILGYFTLQY